MVATNLFYIQPQRTYQPQTIRILCLQSVLLWDWHETPLPRLMLSRPWRVGHIRDERPAYGGEFFCRFVPTLAGRLQVADRSAESVSVPAPWHCRMILGSLLYHGQRPHVGPDEEEQGCAEAWMKDLLHLLASQFHCWVDLAKAACRTISQGFHISGKNRSHMEKFSGHNDINPPFLSRQSYNCN